MATLRTYTRSFNGGEVSEAVAARWDVAKYTAALSLEFSPNKMRGYYRGELVTRTKLTITAITPPQTGVMFVDAVALEP